ncbi:MAG: helix-turn-helix transcriptional regulator [Alphaproteobacteria bacterium]|nr:helix-turn-helix transcriptional regulator [Alphaproteobacteria bacterium]
MVPAEIYENNMGRGFMMELPQDVGTGRVEFIEISDQMRILIFDCTWFNRRKFLVHDDDWVRFNFGLSLDVTMNLDGSQKVHIDTASWRVINNPDGLTTIEEIPANTRSTWVTICCKPEYIARLSGYHEDDLPNPLRSSFCEKSGISFYQPFDLTSRLNTITNEILNNSLSGGFRLSLCLAKANEILCHAIYHVLHPEPKNKIPAKLDGRDKDAIARAREILRRNFANPPTVREISTEIGINRNKLYYGFKYLFDQTISEYVQDLRLTEAHHLLRETDLGLLEIATMVGFRHQCNFSTAIKKRYGSNPVTIRNEP